METPKLTFAAFFGNRGFFPASLIGARTTAFKTVRIHVYLGEGSITADLIPQDFFGCAGVAEVPDLQDVLQTIGATGHRHHVAVTPGRCTAPLREALEKYLGFDVALVGRSG